jgi:hypothetical protein
MANPTGSSRWCLRPRLRRALLALAGVGLATAGRAALPDYVREALGRFSAELPANWAYTTTTVRKEVSTTERYDPAKPPGERWALLLYNGRPPTAPELEKYRRLRAANPQPASPGNFARGDIEPGSLQLVAEDAAHAEFLGGFREVAAGADKMLLHLQLRLTVSKPQPHVEKYLLFLREPYSPILGVKMNELRVEVTFTPPAAGRPSLPATVTSHFRGRILLIGTEEDLRVEYSDFTPAGPE